MKNIIYDIKSEATNLRQKSDEELKGKMLQLKEKLAFASNICMSLTGRKNTST